VPPQRPRFTALGAWTPWGACARRSRVDAAGLCFGRARNQRLLRQSARSTALMCALAGLTTATSQQAPPRARSERRASVVQAGDVQNPPDGKSRTGSEVIHRRSTEIFRPLLASRARRCRPAKAMARTPRRATGRIGQRTAAFCFRPQAPANRPLSARHFVKGPRQMLFISPEFGLRPFQTGLEYRSGCTT
jgi:hypothetical protein